MNEQTELQTTIQSALKSVKSDPNHNLDPRKRIELYTLFGEYDADKHLGRIAPVRGYLALKTARRVAYLWDDVGHELLDYFLKYGNINIDEQPLRHPQKMHWLLLLVCEDVLLRKVNRQTVEEAASFLYYRMDGLIFAISDLLEKKAISPASSEALSYWSAYSALQACRNALREVRGIRDIPVYTNRSSFPFILEDTAYFAMRAECGDDAEKRLIFWTWWLTEAILQAWEQAHGAGY